MNKRADEISVLAVYQALGNEPAVPFWSVPATGSEQFISLIIAKAENTFQQVLSQYSIQDLVDNRNNDVITK